MGGTAWQVHRGAGTRGGHPLRNRRVRRHRGRHHGAHGGVHVAAGHLLLRGGELHPLLLLALVAEPHAHHVLLQVELLGDGGDLLPGRAGLHREVGLQRPLLRGGDRRPFTLLTGNERQDISNL